LSPDGRWVLFSSAANNLVTGGNNRFALNLYLRDRASNTTVLVSANLSGTGGGNASSMYGQISTNGRYVVFQSDATDLLPGDTNGVTDVFVRDVLTGSNILVSVATDGGWANGPSAEPTITPDGRYVAFVSQASNLVPGDTNGIADIFVRDVVNQTTTLASVGATSSPLLLIQPFIMPSSHPALSPDGHEVAFFTTARGLVPGVPSASAGEVYVRDLVGNNTLWVSSNTVAMTGYPSNGASHFLSYHPALSDDGRFVAFKLSAYTGLGPAAIFQYDMGSNSLGLITTNALSLAFNDDVYGPEMTPDGRFIAFASGSMTSTQAVSSSIYLADTQAGTNLLVSICQDGTRSTNSISDAPALSADGRFVAFLSNATNLVANAISNGFHIYLRDTVAGSTLLVDADTNGIGSSDEYGNAPSLSADGRWVAFASPDGSLVSQDNNRALDVFVSDTLNGTNELISRREPAAASVTGSGFSSACQLSLTPNGQWMVFSSYADDLVTNDFNREQDVYVRDLLGGTLTLVSVGSDGNAALGGTSSGALISTNGRVVVFTSTATNLVPNYTNPFGDIFLRDLVTGTNTLVSVSVDGVTAGKGASLFPAMSQDGRYVAFVSTATNLVSPPTTSGWNVFWRDTVADVTLALTTNVSPTATLLFPPSMSADGRYVAYSVLVGSSQTVTVWDAVTLTNIYTAPGSGLIAASAALSPRGARLLYQGNTTLKVADLVGKTNLFSISSLASVDGRAQWSADERFFAMVVHWTSGVATNNQVYLGDVRAGSLALISVTPDHARGGNAPSDNPALSADGRYMVYRTSATDIAPATLSGSAVVLYDRSTGSNTVLNAGLGGDWTSWASRPIMDGSRTVVFQSCQSVLVPPDLNRLPDLFAQAPDVTLDSDGDGIPDWWMMKYFGHPTGQANDHSQAQDDADGDGFTNYQEFLTGTDPTNPNSYFHLQISQAAAPNLLLSWPSVPGKSYQVQFNVDLTSLSWANLGAAVVATSSGSLIVTPAQPAVYYRVVAID
jgi:Tol biopolymer transport system component